MPFLIQSPPDGMPVSCCPAENASTCQLAGLFLHSLVGLVHPLYNLIGNVVSRVGIEDVVAAFGENDGIFLVLVVIPQVVVYAVRQSLVVLGHLVLVFRTQPLLQCVSVLCLFLYACLDLLCLCLCVFVGLYVLLEVSGGGLNSFLLAGESALYVGFLSLMIFVTSFQ